MVTQFRHDPVADQVIEGYAIEFDHGFTKLKFKMFTTKKSPGFIVHSNSRNKRANAKALSNHLIDLVTENFGGNRIN
jgi:hypothetical protein